MRLEAICRATTVLLGLICVMGTAGFPQKARKQPKPIVARDLTLHETTVSTGSIMGTGGQTSTSVNYFGRQGMRRSAPNGIDTLIRVSEGRIITINHKEKTYSSMTVQELNRELEKAAAEMTEDKVQMDAVRKAMGQMMESISVTMVGPGEPIAGYRTVKYMVKGVIQMEIWAAPELKVPPLYYDALKMSVRPSPLFDTRRMFEEFKKIDGMTLKTIQTIKMKDMEITSTTVVTSVDKAPIPSSAFEVPAGYKQVASDILK